MNANETYVFLLGAEREFACLLKKLGHTEHAADLRAFTMTQELAAGIRESRALWAAAH